MGKRIIKVLGLVLGVVLLGSACGLLFLTVTEYRPADSQAADRIVFMGETEPAGQSLTLCTWNIGYAGLGRESDFFMDGGKMVNPPSQEAVEENMAGILSYMQEEPADVWLMQEVDTNSARSGGMDQFEQVSKAAAGSAAFAYNYRCPFVPIPLPPIGRVESGLATAGRLETGEDAERISLPCPFSWPTRTANIKRCLLVSRAAVEGTDRELVLVNLHLEAFESGAGRIEQTKRLMELLTAEYEAGNYVIAGGDFNQSFPGTLESYPISETASWKPGRLEESTLPEGWQFVCDSTAATCRSLDQPYSEDCQLYVIDGFILSPNVRPDAVETERLEFMHSDHNPVRLDVTLLP